MYCTNCGKASKVGDKFCTSCGNKLLEVDEGQKSSFQQNQTTKTYQSPPQQNTFHQQYSHHQPPQQYSKTVIVMGNQKSVIAAFLLALFFGPIGLFYASIVGGILMSILLVIIGIISIGGGIVVSVPVAIVGIAASPIAIIIIWFTSIIWAMNSVNDYNKKFAERLSNGG